MEQVVRVGVSNFTFGLYVLYLLDFFLRFTARVPALGQARLTAILFVFTAIMVLIQKNKSKNLLQDNKVKLSLNVFLLYLIFSLPLVEFPGSALKNNLDTFLKAIVFFYFTIVCCDSIKRFKLIVFVFVCCQLFRILEPLIIYILTGDLGDSTYLGDGEFAGRLSGSSYDVINANELGFVIATVVPYLYYLMFQSRNKKLKLISLVLAPMLIYALVLTMSRGAMLALLVVFYFIYKESNKKLLLSCLLLTSLVVTWSHLSPLQKDRYLSLVSSDSQFSGSSDGRYAAMRSEFRLGFSRPVVGHGIGTTPEAKFHYYGIVQASHILWAELVIETGLIGLLLFLRFLLLLKKNINILRNHDTDNPLHSHFVKTFVCIFWMFCVYSTNYWGVSQYYWYFFAGLVVAYTTIIKQEKNGF